MAIPAAPNPVRPDETKPGQRIYLRKYGSWRRFHHGPRQGVEPLLKMLPAYPDCVLVAGCQRSGTTMLTRIIAQSRGFRPLHLTHDDELDAALALAGYIDLPSEARYCFQTTYLNERYGEYSMLGPHQRLIWVLRNPHSVIYSMMHNWRRWALNELFESCRAAVRATALDGSGRSLFGPSRLHKACVAYAGKTAQVLRIRELVPAQKLMIIDYDELVGEPGKWLPSVFAFIGQKYDPAYGAAVRGDSRHKADRLTVAQRSLIEQVAMPVYQQCLPLCDAPAYSG